MTSDEKIVESAASHSTHKADTAGSEPEPVVVPATAGQARYFNKMALLARSSQDTLIPVTRHSSRHVLGAMTGERRASLHMRLAGQVMDGPGKIDAAAGRIAAIWRDHPGLQVVFCDTGLDSPPPRWNIRGELAMRLNGNRVPASEIRFAADHRRAAGTLAAECEAGAVRVLIGSTAHLFAVPVHPRYIAAAHHLDAPFSPIDAARRDARSPRTGNAAAMIFRYVTKESTDAAQWQALDAVGEPHEAALSALTGRPVPLPLPGSRTARPTRSANTATRKGTSPGPRGR